MKTTLKKFCIWLATIAILAATCLLPCLSQNTLAVTAGDAAIYMSNASKVQEVANTFKKCLRARFDKGAYGYMYHSDSFTGNIFGGVDTNISAGAWLEHAVQNKVDNGEIWCENNSSNIVNVFASAVGVSWQNLICNGNAPGMMTLQVYKEAKDGKVAHWENTDTACDIGLGVAGYKFDWVNEEAATAYAKSLYDNYLNSNPDVAKYLPAWDDVGNFSDKRVAYFVYLNDFKTACTNGEIYSGDRALMNESYYFPAVKEIDPNTGILQEVYYRRSVSKKNWGSSIVGSSGAHTCDTVITKLNDYADAVAQEAGAIIEEAKKEAEEAAAERSKIRCKMLALYASVEFDAEGNVTKKIDFGGEPSAAYYYLKAQKIVDDPDAARAEIVKQLRDELTTSKPNLSEAEIDTLIAEQESQINDTHNALLARAQLIYDKFNKVLSAAGSGTGDGNEETSYWYKDKDGNIVCTNFDTFDDTITNDSGYQDLLDKLLNNATASTNPNQQNPSGGESNPCTDAAGALGWILCPVLNMVSQGVDEIYNNFIQKQFLEVDSTRLDPNSANGKEVYGAWRSIRDIANVIFIALFMVVLFSQFTGFGLTNYSVKKMLPKLIMVSVLVNISFLLCQFAVDISNVLGYSLNSLFDSLGSTTSNIDSHFNDGASGWLNFLQGTILVGGIATAGSWLPTFLLVLLSAAVSVFFGALVLGARQAGIFILIVLSPAAIVCYALPNSKKFFDRWLNTFIALLMVFPICGALMGGGNFASAVLIGNGNWFVKLVAMLLRVVPFFLIPGLVRSSMAAIGNLGAKIAGVGSRLGGNLTGAAKKSDGFQRMSELGEQARGRGIAARHKLWSKLTGGRFTGTKGAKRRLARAIGLQEARLRSDAKAGAIAAGGFISSGRADDIMSSAEDAEENQGVKDAEAGYRLNMDTGNYTAVDNELQTRLNELQTNPGNIEVRRKVKALMKILLESDDGRGALTETVQKFAEANHGSKAEEILARYLGNGENMGKIKAANQRGLQNLVKSMSSGAAIQSLAQYGAMGTDKINAKAVGGMDVSSLRAQVAAAKAGTLNGTALQQLAGTYTQALTSENAANEINKESADELNKIRELAYMANNGGSNVGFKNLAPGDELKIMRTKAAVPTGWTASGVWVGGGSGPTQQQQIAYQEWAKHSAEVDRHNSQV